MCADGTNRWAPYARMGNTTLMGRRRVRKGATPFPGREIGFRAKKTALAKASLFVKWWFVFREGVSQYPSHLSTFAGLIITSPRAAAVSGVDPLCHLVRQWTRSDFGSEKERPRRSAFASSIRKAS